MDERFYERFDGIPTGNICDTCPTARVLKDLMPLDPGMHFAGRALTIKCEPGDNLPIHKSFTVSRAGDVLVVGNGGFIYAGMFGEMLCLSCIARGIRAFVTDGGVRDRSEIIESGFPCYCGGVCPAGTGKKSNQGVGEDLTIAGADVKTGDVIVGDSDGVVVIPFADADEAYAKALAKKEKEDSMREKLRSGVTVGELLGLDRLY